MEPPGGILGVYVGAKLPALNAPTMTERRLLEKAGRVTMVITVVHICLIASWSLAMVYRVGPTFVLLILFGSVTDLVFCDTFWLRFPNATLGQADSGDGSRGR